MDFKEDPDADASKSGSAVLFQNEKGFRVVGLGAGVR